MSFHGDIKLGSTIYVPFCTVQTTGAPFTLAGSPVVSAYVGSGLTQITAGITLGVDHDGVTGLNMLTIVATSGNGFATATDVALVITVGTVNSVSVVGYVVGAFSIENRRADVQFWNGTQVATPATAGIPDINVKNMNNVAATPITTIKAVQGLAVDGVVTTVTNQLTAAVIATGVWQDATAGDFTTASSIGKSLYTAGVVPGGTNGLFIAGTNAATTITTSLTTTFTGNLTGSVGSVTGAVGSVTGAVGSVTGAVGSVTGNVGGNVAGSVGSVVGAVGSVTGLTASDVGAIKTKTDFLPSATAGAAGGVFIAGSNAATTVNVTGNITGNLSGSVGSVTGAVGSVTGAVGSVTGAVGSVTAGVTVTTNSDKTGYRLDATGSAALTEGYAADGSAATLPQLLYLMLAALTEFSISGTTMTWKKLDGSTTAATGTLDSATVPTSITRAT